MSDVQTGALGVADKDFRAYIEESLDDPLARYIGVGDYTDSLSPSNRAHLEAAFIKGDLYDTARDMLDGAAQNHVQEFLRLVEGTEGKWDFLTKGHHLWTYKERQDDGTYKIRTTDHDIADALAAPYLGSPGKEIPMVLVSYVFPATKPGGKKSILRMFVWHGQGGGQSFASPLNQLEKMARAYQAHIYLIAHHHKLVAGRYVKLYDEADTSLKLRATDSAVVAAGSWLRGHMPDEITYAEDAGYVPLAIGAPVISARNKGNSKFRVRVTL